MRIALAGLWWTLIPGTFNLCWFHLGNLLILQSAAASKPQTWRGGMFLLLCTLYEVVTWPLCQEKWLKPHATDTSSVVTFAPTKCFYYVHLRCTDLAAETAGSISGILAANFLSPPPSADAVSKQSDMLLRLQLCSFRRVLFILCPCGSIPGIIMHDSLLGSNNLTTTVEMEWTNDDMGASEKLQSQGSNFRCSLEVSHSVVTRTLFCCYIIPCLSYPAFCFIFVLGIDTEMWSSRGCVSKRGQEVYCSG